MKSLKRIITFILAVCMIVSVFSLASCKKKNDDDNNDKTDTNSTQTTDKTYTVTVLDGDNNPVAGVMIGVMTNSYKSHMTDANGKISFESDSANAKVMIISVPEGYEKPENAEKSFSAGNKNITFTIEEKVVIKTTVTYTVTVIDQFGDPVSNVTVQLCTDTMCYDTTTDEDGVGVKELTPGVVYEVKIPNPPAGYSAPTGYFASIPADETEITVEITKN